MELWWKFCAGFVSSCTDTKGKIFRDLIPCEHNQQTHWVPVLLVLRLYMFRAVFLPIIRSFLAVHRYWYNLCNLVTVCYQVFHPAPDSTRSPNCINCNNADVRLRNSWWWEERLPETCRFVIPIKLELSASVGFIHKESITMHGHTILKFVIWIFRDFMRWKAPPVNVPTISH
jgi:hypothetical protein